MFFYVLYFMFHIFVIFLSILIGWCLSVLINDMLCYVTLHPAVMPSPLSLYSCCVTCLLEMTADNPSVNIVPYRHVHDPTHIVKAQERRALRLQP